MSTSKGSQARKRPQKHQNRTAFKNDLHDTSRKTKLLNAMEISGVCKRCKDIIGWKIKYKKYKPLSGLAKCVSCGEKAVRHAYHVLCSKCALDKKVCAKCCKQGDNNTEEIQNNMENNQDLEFQSALKRLPERKRRTVMRYLNKQGENKLTPGVMNYIDEVMAGVSTINLEDDFDSSSEEHSDDSDEEK